MRCVRHNQRLGTWAALFALTVQLFLSFGHVHLDDLTPPSPAAAGLSLEQTGNRDRTPPAHHDGGAGDVCAICATIGLLASSVLPEPAQVALPIAIPSVWTSDLAAVASRFDQHLLFRARAPPVIG
jgi:hypothetical protein